MSIHDKRIEFGSDNAQDKQKALRASGDMNADFLEMARNVYAHLNDEISKKIFEDSAALPFSQNKAEKYAQIRFLTNACVDTMVDYFKGNIDLSLDEVVGVIINFLNNMRK